VEDLAAGRAVRLDVRDLAAGAVPVPVVAQARRVRGERMTLAHIGAMPVEELLSLAPAAAAFLLALRARDR
jgi:hypothetical protein